MNNDDNRKVGVYGLRTKPYGKTFAQCSANWCAWVLTIPKEDNPILDDTGENSSQKQSGPVWFLAGTIGGQAYRKCIIPAGKGILFPIVVKECSFTEDKDVKTAVGLSARVKEDMDHVLSMETDIDGIKLRNLEKYRVPSKPFNLVFPPSNIYDVEPGPTLGVCNGFWVLLKPLQIGTHTIHFGACVYVREGSVLAELSKRYNRMDGNLFRTEVTYNITVKS